MSPGAVASQRNTGSVDAQLPGVAVNNQRASLRIVMSGRESMLRRQPVLHGDNVAAAVICQLAELMVMRGETAADKAATVEIDNGR